MTPRADDLALLLDPASPHRRRLVAAAASMLGVALLPPACAVPDRAPSVHAVAGMAGRNDRDEPHGDGDNLAGGLGLRLPIGEHLCLRCEGLVGDYSVLVAPTLTYDFRLAGPDASMLATGLRARADADPRFERQSPLRSAPGSIDAHVGVGWTWLSRAEHNVLGDRDSPVLRVGAEGHLVHGLLGGAALLVAPLGYDENAAVAGLFYVGVRF